MGTLFERPPSGRLPTAGRAGPVISWPARGHAALHQTKLQKKDVRVLFPGRRVSIDQDEQNPILDVYLYLKVLNGINLLEIR